ncbi:hypothetical protein ACHWQZ_G016221 [Mnemiopsis leidyi]
MMYDLRSASNEFSNVTTDILYPIDALDKVFGIAHALCFIIGLLGNIVLIWYFMTHVRYDLPTILYIMCCVNDLLTASLVLFVAVSFLNKRDAQFFEDATFCKCWALLSRINHRISVFLVMVLSISRTVSLTTPLRMIKRRFALVSIGVWVFLAILYEVVLTSAGFYHSVYERRDAFCDMEFGDTANLTALSKKVDVVGTCVTYAAPVTVVMISCLVCVINLKRGVCANNMPHIMRMKQKATVTIIIFTVVFIILNIPELVQTVMWFVVVNKYGYWPGPPDFLHPFIYFYFKNFTNVLCLGINATANPIVLFWRMQRYQQWLKRETHGFVSYGGKMATGLNSAVQGELRNLNAMVELTGSQIRSASEFVREYSQDRLFANDVNLERVRGERYYEDRSEKSSVDFRDQAGGTVTTDICVSPGNDSIVLVSAL